MSVGVNFYEANYKAILENQKYEDFQNLCSRIFEYCFEKEGFQSFPLKEPDGGNDGYLPSKGIYFQMYAPKNLDNKSRSEIKAKMNKDVETLIEEWHTIRPVNKWIFLTQKLLKKEHLLILGELSREYENVGIVFENKDTHYLIDCIKQLTEDQLSSIFGANAPTSYKMVKPKTFDRQVDVLFGEIEDAIRSYCILKIETAQGHLNDIREIVDYLPENEVIERYTSKSLYNSKKDEIVLLGVTKILLEEFYNYLDAAFHTRELEVIRHDRKIKCTPVLYSCFGDILIEYLDLCGYHYLVNEASVQSPVVEVW